MMLVTALAAEMCDFNASIPVSLALVSCSLMMMKGLPY